MPSGDLADLIARLIGPDNKGAASVRMYNQGQDALGVSDAVPRGIVDQPASPNSVQQALGANSLQQAPSQLPQPSGAALAQAALLFKQGLISPAQFDQYKAALAQMAPSVMGPR